MIILCIGTTANTFLFTQANTVSLWHCGQTGEPTQLHELPHVGDVTEITVSLCYTYISSCY